MDIYVVIETGVNNPDDDSPTSEGDDPIVSLSAYGLRQDADDAAKRLFKEITKQHTDRHHKPKTEEFTLNGMPEYEVHTSFTIYRVSISKLALQ